MAQVYSDPTRADETFSLPDVEVFRVKAGATAWDECPAAHENADDHTEECTGFYYWFCFPGCVPDSDAYGPYETEEAAIEAAQEGEAR